MASRSDSILKRRFITSDDIWAVSERGDEFLPVPEHSTVTEEAKELALKLNVRFQDGSGLSGRENTERMAASKVTSVPDLSTAQSTMSSEMADRVSQAIAAVLSELQLSDRVATLQPIVTRRVFAGLAKERN